MACTNCFENCGDKHTSDKCVEYTGDPIESLGICTGDSLSVVEAAVINGLISALDGTGITLEDVTLANCPYLLGKFVGKNPTLVNFIQLLIDSECELKGFIDDINSQLNSSTTFDTGCLSGLPTNPGPNAILQTLLSDYCTTKAIVNSFSTTYVRISDLPTLVTQIVQNINTGGSTIIQYASYLPAKVAMPYFGDLSGFDNTGKGLQASGLQGLYLCNGLNGTPDCRGRVVVGAIKNVPGGSYDAAVDPGASINPNTNYAALDRFGENYHVNTTLEIPPHTHSVIDPGHKHVQTVFQGIANGGAIPVGFANTSNNLTGGYSTLSSQTGITIGSTGSGNAHENRQPSIAAYWIIKL